MKEKLIFNIAINLQTQNKRLKGCNANVLSWRKIPHLGKNKVLEFKIVYSLEKKDVQKCLIVCHFIYSTKQRLHKYILYCLGMFSDDISRR